jgi:hypothetical protein
VVIVACFTTIVEAVGIDVEGSCRLDEESCCPSKERFLTVASYGELRVLTLCGKQVARKRSLASAVSASV